MSSLAQRQPTVQFKRNLLNRDRSRLQRTVGRSTERCATQPMIMFFGRMNIKCRALWLQLSLICCVACLLIGTSGCGTTTTGTATEQLLISDAVDQAIGQIDFQAISGRKVYLETDYFKSLKGTSIINAEYITSSLRQQLTAARCYLQESRDDAEIIVEPRVGALGTDGHEIIYGMPRNNSLSTAASAFSNAPVPTIPEISIGKVNSKSGIAKLIVFAYDRESSQPVWQSGIAKAESTSKDTWMFGAGPFQKGTIHDGTRFAGEKFGPPQFQKIVFEPPPFVRQLEAPFRSRPENEDNEPISGPLSIADSPPKSTVPIQDEHYFIRDPATIPVSAESDADGEAEKK